MRLIDADELIKEIKDCESEVIDSGLPVRLAFVGVVDTIYNFPTADKWIPCSSRLPETEQYILLSFENFSLPVVGRYEEDENGGAFYCGDEEETLVSQNMYVNAWMPLPKPYKGDDLNG